MDAVRRGAAGGTGVSHPLQGRTLDAYCHDLRTFFQWATDLRLAVREATRPHIEL
jgi:hypothetical protein